MDNSTIWDKNDTVFTNTDQNSSKVFWVGLFIILSIFTVFVGWGYMATQGVGLYYSVAPHEFAVIEYGGGGMAVIEKVGKYFKGVNRVHKIPREITFKYSSETKDAVKVTFTDGGSALIDVSATVKMPESHEKLIELIRAYGGDRRKLKWEIGLDVASVLASSASTIDSISVATGGEGRGHFNKFFSLQMFDGLYDRIKIKGSSPIKYKFVKHVNGYYVKAKDKKLFYQYFEINPWISVVTAIHFDDDVKRVLEEKQEAYLKLQQAEAKAKANMIKVDVLSK